MFYIGITFTHDHVGVSTKGCRILSPLQPLGKLWPYLTAEAVNPIGAAALCYHDCNSCLQGITELVRNSAARTVTGTERRTEPAEPAKPALKASKGPALFAPRRHSRRPAKGGSKSSCKGSRERRMEIKNRRTSICSIFLHYARPICRLCTFNDKRA